MDIVQRFAGRLSKENRQGIPCGFVSTLHITTSGLSPALWFIQCTCTLQNHKVHPVCFLLTTYLQRGVGKTRNEAKQETAPIITPQPKTLKPSPNSAQYSPNSAQYSPNVPRMDLTAPSTILAR